MFDALCLALFSKNANFSLTSGCSRSSTHSGQENAEVVGPLEGLILFPRLTFDGYLFLALTLALRYSNYVFLWPDVMALEFVGSWMALHCLNFCAYIPSAFILKEYPILMGKSTRLSLSNAVERNKSFV
jgi:hypothetical protein